MPGQIPNPVWLYRIVHVNNIPHILRNGICTRNHALADPNYINIGDSNLIQQRSVYNVGISPYGTLGDYVPFYFGPLSPMLFNIVTGYRGITQYDQKEIVYICCELNDVILNCPDWFFTDGHAKNILTNYYNIINDLSNVDWNMVNERFWTNNSNDRDRMRRKQAEFLVKNIIPNCCIASIVVFDNSAKNIIDGFVSTSKLNVNVQVIPNFYY